MTAGIEGGRRRVILEEWTWADWMDISAAWERTAPPVHFTTLMIARGLGASAPSSGAQPKPEIQEANPEALAAFFGQSGDLPVYVPPKKGL